MSNDLINGSISFVAGNVVGTTVDKIISILDDRFNLTGRLGLTMTENSFGKAVISLLLQIGLISAGTHFVTNAFPWLSENTAGFSLYIIGLSITSDKLKHNVSIVNDILFNVPTPTPTLISPVKDI